MVELALCPFVGRYTDGDLEHLTETSQQILVGGLDHVFHALGRVIPIDQYVQYRGSKFKPTRIHLWLSDVEWTNGPSIPTSKRSKQKMIPMPGPDMAHLHGESIRVPQAPQVREVLVAGMLRCPPSVQMSMSGAS